MKKINIRTVILIGMCIILGFLFVKNGIESKYPKQPQSVQQQQKPSVSVTIDSGKSTELLTASVSASTPFEALMAAAETNKRSVETKQYDFGMFVTAVGDVGTKDDFGWIYYVNNVSGDVASDRYQLKSGDQVQWKFEKSTF